MLPFSKLGEHCSESVGCRPIEIRARLNERKIAMTILVIFFAHPPRRLFNLQFIKSWQPSLRPFQVLWIVSSIQINHGFSLPEQITSFDCTRDISYYALFNSHRTTKSLRDSLVLTCARLCLYINASKKKNRTWPTKCDLPSKNTLNRSFTLAGSQLIWYFFLSNQLAITTSEALELREFLFMNTVTYMVPHGQSSRLFMSDSLDLWIKHCVWYTEQDFIFASVQQVSLKVS